MKSIIEREATFENNSDMEIKVIQQQLSRAFLKETQWSKTCSTVKSTWQAKHFIVPKKLVEQINDYIFIDTFKSNKIKIDTNEMRVDDCWTNKQKTRVHRDGDVN